MKAFFIGFFVAIVACTMMQNAKALEVQEKDMSTFLWAVCIHTGKHETQECLLVRDAYVAEGMAAEGKRKSELVVNLYLYIGYLTGVDEARDSVKRECEA